MALGLTARLRGVQESTGGFSDIEPGAYKLVITSVEPKPDQEYVRIYWDVAEGPRKGAYASSGFPPSDVLSWKDAALGMLKGKLHRIWQCNQQRLHATSDAEGKFLMVSEFDDGNFDALVGCRFGAVVRRRLYTKGPNSKAPGADGVAIEVARYLTPEEYERHDWPESLLEDRNQRDRQAQAPMPVAVPQGYQPQPVPMPQGYAPQGQPVPMPQGYGQAPAPAPDVYQEDIPF